MKFRIVHVYKDVYPPVEGGIERIIHHLALRTHGIELFEGIALEVGILTASRSLKPSIHSLVESSTIEVKEVPSFGRILSTPLAPGFIRALCQTKADLFHFHIPHPMGEVAFLLSGIKTPAVATYHSDVVRQRIAMIGYAPVFRRFLDRMARIMPTSTRYCQSSPWLNQRQSQCCVIPLGYPLETYRKTVDLEPKVRFFQEKYGRYVLFLGCLRSYKGLPYLINAAIENPQIRLVIAGDGNQRQALMRQAQKANLLDERIWFLGHVDEKDAIALLYGAQALVLPSHQRSEAFGLCQIEAMACGIPVVSTDLPTGVPEVNVHGVCGLVVPPGDAKALAQAILCLLKDELFRCQLGELGKQHAWNFFHANRMAEMTLDVYREVLKNSSTLAEA